ncbi:hypothetical protein FOMPIDRAFT_1017471 [Fomitopsis schrenkii]|uniref:Enoyl reductase (ER) domain-containing protein n=1 Tax=Fomitopsis schrenkii TaxID=2126942 RepID=S8E5X0_FOMSC|nr:hypothetical protein FOMPIDRAFT_1017471 [Fomitopsis schrenkii]
MCSRQVAKVQEVPVPEIDEWEVLVKVVAVALNPTDYMYIKNVTKSVYQRLRGVQSYCEARKQSLHYKPQDRRSYCRIHPGGTYTDRGAFAEYVKAPYDLCFRVPEGTFSHEEAATVTTSCGYWTAVQSIFHPSTRLGLIEAPTTVEDDQYIFIYGGSSSVGMYALRLAHAVGYKVVTVASPKNHALCKSFGADVVFDDHAHMAQFLTKTPELIASGKIKPNPVKA